MRNSARYFIYAFFGALAAGCADTNNFPLISSNHPLPAEEILISNEEFDKPHRILGPVQYTLRSRPSLFTSQLEFREQAIDLLKQQTYAKYGDSVDAIIDTKVEESTIEDADGKLNIVNIQGVAISFIQPASKQEKSSTKSQTKRKQKSAKKILIVKKTKPVKKVTDKPVPRQHGKSVVKNTEPKSEEITITPSEILK